MKEVVRVSDIVLQILDARFIEETRNLKLEADIKKMGKKIIYVINKADLVDAKEIEKHLTKDLMPYVLVSAKTGKGGKDLRDKIRIEAKRVDAMDKKRVQVGIVGYPNAGKSSLINMIARRAAAKTSKQAGYTRGMQKIRLVKGVLLLDTPGVIPDSKYSSFAKEKMSLDTKLGARTYSDTKDPEDIVASLMKDNAKKIEKFYKIKSKGDSEILIEELGQQRNLLKKGGKIDIDRTARQVLRDWQEGKIR